MIVPWQELDSETLNNIVKEYILQNLEDYQMPNTQVDHWIAQVLRQLKAGEAVVEWSEINESVTIVDAKKYS